MIHLPQAFSKKVIARARYIVTHLVSVAFYSSHRQTHTSYKVPQLHFFQILFRLFFSVSSQGGNNYGAHLKTGLWTLVSLLFHPLTGRILSLSLSLASVFFDKSRRCEEEERRKKRSEWINEGKEERPVYTARRRQKGGIKSHGAQRPVRVECY